LLAQFRSFEAVDASTKENLDAIPPFLRRLFDYRQIGITNSSENPWRISDSRIVVASARNLAVILFFVLGVPGETMQPSLANVWIKRFRKGLAMLSFAAFLVGAVRPAHGQSPTTAKKILIDTDPGTDDALAILLALNSPEIDVRAITIVAGNVTSELGLENALKVMSLAGRCDISVAKGAAHPLFQKLNTEEFWNGKNGLGGAELPPSRCDASSQFGPDLIIETVRRYPHEITLVPIGPLTNIALAISKDPSIIPLVKEVVLMGGSITGGNVNAASEFNIHSDPEAASVVFNAGWPITMVGLDVTEHTLITDADVGRLERAGGPEASFAAAVARFQIGTYQGTGFGGGAVHDALAVGAVIDRSVLKTQGMRVDIETDGRFTRGETVGNRGNAVDRIIPKGDRLETVGVDAVQPNVQVAVGVDSSRFIELLVNRLSHK
jgi:purine nucleosidase